MAKIFYVMLGSVLAITILYPIILTATTPFVKSQFVEVILEERSKNHPVFLILVVDSPALSGVTLPKEIGGTPVKLVNETEFEGLATLPYTMAAVRFARAKLSFHRIMVSTMVVNIIVSGMSRCIMGFTVGL